MFCSTPDLILGSSKNLLCRFNVQLNIGIRWCRFVYIYIHTISVEVLCYNSAKVPKHILLGDFSHLCLVFKELISFLKIFCS